MEEASYPPVSRPHTSQGGGSAIPAALNFERSVMPLTAAQRRTKAARKQSLLSRATNGTAAGSTARVLMDEGPTYDEEDNWQGPEGCIPIGGMHLHRLRRPEHEHDHNSPMNPCF